MPDNRPGYSNWSVTPASLSSPEEVRKLIDIVLRRKPPEQPKTLFKRPPVVRPRVFYRSYQDKDKPWTPEQDNPDQEMAVERLLSEYPETWRNVERVRTGVNLGPGTGGTHYPFFKEIHMAPSWGRENDPKFTYPENVSNFGHELAHAKGLEDEGPHPTTYDIGFLFDELYKNYKDIELPSERRRSVGGVRR